MKKTITYEPKMTTGDLITYANNEWAFVHEDYIASIPSHSTAIEHWAYYPKTGKLVVVYKSSPNTFYRYEGVGFATIFAMLTADSLGAFIAKEIKPNHSLAL